MIVLQAFLVLRSAPRVKCAVRLVVQARHFLEEDQSGSYVVLVLIETNNVHWRLHSSIVRYRSDLGEGKLAKVFRTENLPCTSRRCLPACCFSGFTIGSLRAQSARVSCEELYSAGILSADAFLHAKKSITPKSTSPGERVSDRSECVVS